MVRFQAHRGAEEEAPENTVAAYRHAWGIDGAVPEVDVRTTGDDVLVCLHDATLARTTDAPPALAARDLSGLTAAEVRSCDAGVRFGPQFAGQRVPLLDEVFAELDLAPERELYLDFKHIAAARLRRLIEERRLAERIILTHGDPDVLLSYRRTYPRIRTMSWLDGDGARVREGFAQLRARQFAGLSQVQVHLAGGGSTPDPAPLDLRFLEAAAGAARACGVELQVRPFAFDAAILRPLLELGIRWYVTGAPARFAACVAEVRTRDPG